jgi:type VI secretion system secreted protein VgrG
VGADAPWVKIMAFTQDDRLIAAITNAGKDVLLLDSFTGQEGISQPFRFNLTMMSEVTTGNPASVDPHALVGTSISVRINRTEPPDGTKIGERYWTGFCERFVKAGQDDNFAYFSATIVPWFSFLNYATNCRIFQKKKVTEIFQEVVAVYGYSDLLTLDLKKDYATRDYCVQYRETDFAFLSRLLEDEGIYYYFQHENGKHKMVLADSVACYQNQLGKSEFKYSPATGLEAAEDTIINWQVVERMHSGKWSSRDFHHESPSNHFERTSPSNAVAAEGKKFEAYDWGEDAKFFNQAGSVGGVPGEAEKSVGVRMEKEEASRSVVNGVSKCCEFTTGFKIKVQGLDKGSTFLLTGISHRAFQAPGYSYTQARPRYENHFDAISSDVPYAPQQVTGRNVIYGLQTAFVIDESPSGNSEEIWPDQYGRVRVRFHWDREAKYACWLRVVQPWAGKSWGQQWIPRVGDEVAVTFIEGDPDLPVIVGSVYNATNMPIFALPDNKTQSGILTHSSEGGGSSNFNMLRFEDKKGSEEIYTQAEKDQNALIKNNETRTVKNNRTSTIHVNDTRTVETGDDTITVQQGNRSITVKQNITTESQSGTVKLTVDSGTLTEFAQGQISITSPTGITLTCGGSKINMTPSQIIITQGATTIDLTAAMATHTSGMIKLNS